MFLYSKLLDVDNLVFNISFSRWTRKGFHFFKTILLQLNSFFIGLQILLNMMPLSIEYLIQSNSSTLLSLLYYLNLIGNDASTVEWKGRKPTGFAWKNEKHAVTCCLSSFFHGRHQEDGLAFLDPNYHTSYCLTAWIFSNPFWKTHRKP